MKLLLLLLSAAGAAAASDPKAPNERAVPGTVVFVCAHGNVKSLIASQWFNRRAAERGLAVRAVSRGVAPENPVPPAIAGRLRQDGFDVTGFEARALAPADAEGASRMVMIGVEPPSWVGVTGRPVETWDGIPPASESYEASRDALRARIEALLDTLKKGKPAR
jgi:protein-tyrosine-phosphatase